MDWTTLFFSILGSGIISAIITSIWNEKTQIKAIRESGLYAKRAEVLDEIIKRTEKVHSLARNVISPYKTSDQENHELFKLIDEFEKYYVNNKHYLPKKVSIEIDNLNNKYFDVYVKSTDHKFIYKKPFKEMSNSDIEKWSRKNMDYILALDDKKEKIVDEFRKIIGVK